MIYLRIFAGIIGILSIVKALPYLFVLLYRLDWIALAIGAVLLAIGLFALWFAVFVDNARERARMKGTLLIGVVIGLVCFLAGFVGPIIFMPESNQGPLLGIFITGPAGFVLGCLGGFVWTRVFW